MCGRYNIIPDADAWAAAFELSVESQNEVKSLSANYNVTPSSQVPIVRSIAQKRTLSHAHWGLIPFWAKDKKIAYKMINARAETVCGKPAFKHAFRQNRCLVVANGFYEWQNLDGQKTKQPYLITIQDQNVFAFAGIWEVWIDPNNGMKIYSCVIVTTKANKKMAQIHERMPVILAPYEYEKWLDADADVAQNLMRPCADERLEICPVSTYVNSPRNNDLNCLNRII